VLQIINLQARYHDTQILTGIDLEVRPGETHVVMGPNGSGKSTLAKAIAGHPDIEITGGSMRFDDHDLVGLEPEERVQAGIFLVFQQPREIAGVNYRQYLHTIHRAKLLAAADKTLTEARKDRELRKRISPVAFRGLAETLLPPLQLGTEFLERQLNVGFSGGEKKKSEILQMTLLKPKLAILDELDSGLDVDALKTVYGQVRALQQETGMSLVLITHYARVLDFLQPDKVHLFENGRISQSGDRRLAERIEKEGYQKA
jgi:Fe-S cluster assembly ATP-binding protein